MRRRKTLRNRQEKLDNFFAQQIDTMSDEAFIAKVQSFIDETSMGEVAKSLIKHRKPSLVYLSDFYEKLDSRAREEMVWAIGETNYTTAMEMLSNALKDDNSRVRLAAAKALAKLNWSPQSEIENAYYLVARQMWHEVAKLGLVAIDPLVNALRDFDGSVSTSALIELQKIGRPAIELLVRAFTDNKFYSRRKHSPEINLAVMRDKSYSTSLRLNEELRQKALNNLNGFLNQMFQVRLAVALGNICDKKDLDLFNNLVTDTQDSYVRKMAQEVIGKIDKKSK